MSRTYDLYAARFTQTVAAVGDWEARSPCEGWSVEDVLDHVITTERDLLAQHTALPPETATSDPATRWRHHLELARARLTEVGDTAYEGMFGPTTVGETMDTFYGFDLIAHRWDIATGAGLDASLTPDELDVLEAMLSAFGEHLYADGICKPAIPTPDDADRQTRVLAVIGRRA